MSASGICDVEGCDRESRTPGSKWCAMHYKRWWKTGRADSPSRPRWVGVECAANDCSTAAKSGGYCGKHWERVRRYGSPDAVQVIHGDPERRFWSHVKKTDTCWLWTSTLTWDGYGLFGVKERRTGAHRWAYMFTVGEIPEGLHLDHLCEVRNCVRPDHLEPVTPAENNRRIWEGRA